MRVAWIWTVREILFDINDPVLGVGAILPTSIEPAWTAKDLVIKRKITPKAASCTPPPQTIYRKVP
jgi:hypothetical protein